MSDTHDTREKPIQSQPAPRVSAENEVLRAHPVKGKIDYAELIRETRARFPKIRARLRMSRTGSRSESGNILPEWPKG